MSCKVKCMFLRQETTNKSTKTELLKKLPATEKESLVLNDGRCQLTNTSNGSSLEFDFNDCGTIQQIHSGNRKNYIWKLMLVAISSRAFTEFFIH